MSLLCWILNSLIAIFYKREYSKFLKIKSPMDIQKNILFKIINDNKNTIYGKKYNFKNIKSISQFQEFVPLSEYEDYIPYIEKIKMDMEK